MLPYCFNTVQPPQQGITLGWLVEEQLALSDYDRRTISVACSPTLGRQETVTPPPCPGGAGVRQMLRPTWFVMAGYPEALSLVQDTSTVQADTAPCW